MSDNNYVDYAKQVNAMIALNNHALKVLLNCNEQLGKRSTDLEYIENSLVLVRKQLSKPPIYSTAFERPSTAYRRKPSKR